MEILLLAFLQSSNTWVLRTNFSLLEVKIDNVEETEKIRNNSGEGAAVLAENDEVDEEANKLAVVYWSEMLVTFPPFSLYQILPVTFDACELAYMRIEGR